MCAAGSLDVKGERVGFGPRIALARSCALGSTYVVSGQRDLRSVTCIRDPLATVSIELQALRL